MKSITMASENRIMDMVRKGIPAANELLYMLDELKKRETCTGVTIKDMKRWGVTLDNANQIEVFVSNTMRGMGVNFEGLLTVTGCLDLHHVTIHDFNKLVIAVQEKYAE